MRHVIILLILAFSSYARPFLNIYKSNDAAHHEIKKAKRIFQKLSKQKIKIKQITLNSFTKEVLINCSTWDWNLSKCFRALYFSSQYKLNTTAHYFILPPMYYQEKYWIGGAALTNCYKNYLFWRKNYWLTGIAFGHYLETQVDGTTRIPQSIAIMLHEWGHLLYGLSHDGDEENFIMSSLFNVKGFSSQSAPELWRFSDKSKKQIRRCKKA